jgi:hypothetical protein
MLRSFKEICAFWRFKEVVLFYLNASLDRRSDTGAIWYSNEKLSFSVYNRIGMLFCFGVVLKSSEISVIRNQVIKKPQIKRFGAF